MNFKNLSLIVFVVASLVGCSDNPHWVISKDSGLQGTYSYELKTKDGLQINAFCNQSMPAIITVEKNGEPIKSVKDKYLKFYIDGKVFENIENEDCRVCAENYADFWEKLRVGKEIQVSSGGYVLSKFTVDPNKVLPDINNNENCQLAFSMISSNDDYKNKKTSKSKENQKINEAVVSRWSFNPNWEQYFYDEGVEILYVDQQLLVNNNGNTEVRVKTKNLLRNGSRVALWDAQQNWVKYSDVFSSKFIIEIDCVNQRDRIIHLEFYEDKQAAGRPIAAYDYNSKILDRHAAFNDIKNAMSWKNVGTNVNFKFHDKLFKYICKK